MSPVEVREWISPALASPDLVLDAQPKAPRKGGMDFYQPFSFSSTLIRRGGGAGRATRGDGGDVSWHGSTSAISLLFPLGLEPELDQAADGPRDGRGDRSAAGPIVKLLGHIRLNANDYRLSGDWRALLAWFRALARG